jgi:hypothetical protein
MGVLQHLLLQARHQRLRLPDPLVHWQPKDVDHIRDVADVEQSVLLNPSRNPTTPPSTTSSTKSIILSRLRASITSAPAPISMAPTSRLN